MPDKISVIIPCYNCADFLGKCAASLQAQTYGEWEAILVNDGSTDETEQLCAALQDEDSRFICVSQPNGGVSAARNHGLRLASGDWVSFLDADDYLSPETLAFAMQAAQREHCELVGWALIEEYGDHTVHKHFADSVIAVSDEKQLEDFRYRVFSGKNAAGKQDEGVHNVVAKLVRRSCIRDLYFDTSLTNHEDMLYAYEMFERVHSAYLEDLPYYHRSMHADSAIAKYRPAILENNRAAAIKYREFLDRYHKAGRYYEVLAGYHVYWLLQIFRLYCFHPDYPGNYRQRKAELQRILDSEPFHSVFRQKPEKLVLAKKVFFFLAGRNWTTLLIQYAKLYCRYR